MHWVQIPWWEAGIIALLSCALYEFYDWLYEKLKKKFKK